MDPTVDNVDFTFSKKDPENRHFDILRGNTIVFHQIWLVCEVNMPILLILDVVHENRLFPPILDTKKTLSKKKKRFSDLPLLLQETNSLFGPKLPQGSVVDIFIGYE